jgi:tRNA (cmo5U34)-methyltransferase
LSDLLDMQEFFTERASNWEHFVKVEWLPQDYEHYYSLLASTIPETESPIRILDVGCGGGIEFEWIFRRAPNAKVTGIDQSSEMLDCLRAKYADQLSQFNLIHESYLTHQFSEEAFDFAITSMSIHYFRPSIRREIYEKIRVALEPGAVYIEGTYCADDEEDQNKRLAHFEEITRGRPGVNEGRYKCNLPLTKDTITRLKEEAGFRDVTWLNNEDWVAIGTK